VLQWPGEIAVEAVILIGLQGAGKSTFYRARFGATHVQVSLDLLKTRHRERTLLTECLAAQRAIVVDNTNPARADREVYIAAAKRAGYRVAGYYFQSRIDDCQRRNSQRAEGQQVPLLGLLGTARRLELPGFEEGFDELHYVRLAGDGQFVVEEWRDEI
jgi:predicted kinase